MSSLSPPDRAPVRYLLSHLAAGGVGSAVFGGLVLGFDMGGLGTLIANAQDGWLFALLLFFGLFVTFGSVALGIGVMSLGKETDQ